MVPAHLVQRLKEEHTAAQAEVVALKARLALIEATPPPARHTSEEDASGEAALGGSEDLLPSAALCALLELHPGKQHQPMAGRDLLALLLDAGHLQLAVARRGARARWQAALKPAIALGAAVTDPWLEYNVHKQPTELAVRCDYDLTPSPNADPDPDPSPALALAPTPTLTLILTFTLALTLTPTLTRCAGTTTQPRARGFLPRHSSKWSARRSPRAPCASACA